VPAATAPRLAAARRIALLLALATAAAGCTRALSVGSEPAPVYRLAVTNEFAESMIVSYNDGRGDSMLGAVAAGRTETFVVAGATSPAVTVSARNASATRSFPATRVDLVAGDVVTVRLRP
jgi:hypothetical protein